MYYMTSTYLDVREIEVDEPRGHHQVRHAPHPRQEHVIGQAKRVRQAGALIQRHGNVAMGDIGREKGNEILGAFQDRKKESHTVIQ
jgi:hypothetical protein